MIIDNMGARQYRRLKTMILITYDTPADLIEAYVEGLKAIIENHPKSRKESYYVALNNLAPSSLEILFSVYLNTKVYEEEVALRQEILLSIIRLTQTLGIRFAFPTSSVHIETFPGTENPIGMLQSPDDLRQLLQRFREDESVRAQTKVGQGRGDSPS
jgi:MscS family membrane protein